MLEARFTAQSDPLRSSEERELAARLVDLKRKLASAFEGVESCRGCARGEPLPKGRWDGGRCCGTETALVFSPHEVRALDAAAVRASELVPPDDELAGCVFRGARGCSLAVEHRATICLVYACADLKTEIASSARNELIQTLRSELSEAFDAFVRLGGDARVERGAPMVVDVDDSSTESPSHRAFQR
jgi:hypothetical protein